tara:strand:+ start:1788 stop:2492 length:705 start_codon:yes stop_codon:yes gene_type:complete
MALPRIDTPTYQTQLPSTGETIQFRPFLVKEQKVIMMAEESKDQNQMVTAMINLVGSCTFNKLDVAKLPTFDVEYLFLQIRGKSVGETIDINVICPDDEVTSALVRVNIDEIKIDKLEEHTNSLNITDTIKVYLRYPCMSDIDRFDNIETTEGMFKILYKCVNEIHYGDDVYHRIDISDKDIEEFVEQLTTEQFTKMTDFFQTMPKLSHTVEVTNPKTNVKSEVVLEGLQSFLE